MCTTHYYSKIQVSKLNATPTSKGRACVLTRQQEKSVLGGGGLFCARLLGLFLAPAVLTGGPLLCRPGLDQKTFPIVCPCLPASRGREDSFSSS